MDFKLELVAIPVTDVDRAKDFYIRAGFNADHDHRVSDELRFVQLTPPGSACSISIGTGITGKPPGSVEGIHLIVADIEAARDQLVRRGVEPSEIFHFGPGGRQPGLDPERRDYGSFLGFSDPDGNSWVVQEVRSRG